MENPKEIQNIEEKETPEVTDQDLKETAHIETENKGGDNESEEVSISKKELETLRKKSEDFEKSIELKRLQKLERKAKEEEGQGEARADDISSLQQQIVELKEMISTEQSTQKNLVLRDAYREFIGDNNWANNDDIFTKISEKFDGSGVLNKEDAIKQLKIIAATQFPNEYESHINAKAKAQALAEASNIKTGSGSGSSVNKQAFGEVSEDQKMVDKFNKNYPIGWAINDKINK